MRILKYARYTDCVSLVLMAHRMHVEGEEVQSYANFLTNAMAKIGALHYLAARITQALSNFPQLPKNKPNFEYSLQPK